jgi:hypothetical protein
MPQWKMIIIVVVLGIVSHRNDTNRMMKIMMILMRKMRMKMIM